MSWLSKIFGSQERDLTSLEIVSQYGATIETTQRGISGLMDASVLPFEKERIREAILDAATHFRDSPEQLRALGIGFAMLGSFQHLSNKTQMPKAQELEAMDEDEFKKHLEGMMGRMGGDSSDRKAAIAETADLEAEWSAHLIAIGASNA